jgi:hypothetical protein
MSNLIGLSDAQDVFVILTHAKDWKKSPVMPRQMSR